MHFGICLGLVTDAAVDGKKGSAVRLAPDTLKKSVLKQLSFQKHVTGLPQSLPNKSDVDHRVLTDYTLPPWVHGKVSELPIPLPLPHSTGIESLQQIPKRLDVP